MVQDGVECIAGVHRDPVFGPVLMFGLGGIHAEICAMSRCACCPSRATTRWPWCASCGPSPCWTARAAAPRVDLDSIADTLCALAGFAQRAGATLESAEINPLIARPREDGGCVAVDALVIGREAA
uniref:Uncharacterized protein n=1 Tax=Chryseobacterium sp. B5 TaxID=2050562 RepID=A0A2G7SNU6_9FLAO